MNTVQVLRAVLILTSSDLSSSKLPRMWT